MVDDMVDEIDEHALQADSDFEISHPDIDSALEMHIGKDDFSYKTKTMDGTTEHLVMRLKKGSWKVHLRIDDEEVKTLDSEEMATFLIHQISMDRAIKRRVLGLLVLFFVLIIPVVAFSVLVLGVDLTNDFDVFLIAGGVSVSLLPVFCFLMSSAERSVDNRVYTNRPNLVDVLQKMMDLKDTPYQKKPLEQRIQRLQGPGQYRID
jgi:hypothetical protein